MGLQKAGGLDQPYLDETEVTITYDAQGFRNPEGLTDWEVVVIGDSFVELGYLPFDDLFTTHIARLLGVRVKNLGVSYAGPLSYIFYLKQYGKARSIKHAIMAFFEGNDIRNLLREQKLLQTFRATGKREYRNIKKQTSFLKAVSNLFQERKVTRKRLFQNAYFKSRDNNIPVSVRYAPPGKDGRSVDQKSLLDSTLSEWSRVAHALGLSPGLVYMPCKRRVLDGYLTFTENADQRLINWRPTDLPEFIRHLSEKNGIRFIDVTSELAAETQKGKLTYNPIWDTHVNRFGSLITAQVIARELRLYQKEAK